MPSSLLPAFTSPDPDLEPVNASMSLSTPPRWTFERANIPLLQGFPRRLAEIGRVLMTPRHNRVDHDLRVQRHVQETFRRQHLILLLCRCLISYGAPTHRLEDYLKSTARHLEIEAHSLYYPGYMTITFDDSRTHTSEVKLAIAPEGIDLSKLSDTYKIYKPLVHDEITVEEATSRLEELVQRPKKFNMWFLILIHGCISVTVAPWAFSAQYQDLPICFFLGCLLGFMRLYLAPKSDLHTALFETVAVTLITLLARGLASIVSSYPFCLSALASSAVVPILPGYALLMAILELLSKSSQAAGSVRMAYIWAYTFLLKHAFTAGAAIWGLIDKNATSMPHCLNPIGYTPSHMFAVPFCICVSILNQAKWKQMPLMVGIACMGLITGEWLRSYWTNSEAVITCFSAFCVSIAANGYHRCQKNALPAATTMLPAILALVPSGLSAQGLLPAGVFEADRITKFSPVNSPTKFDQDIVLTMYFALFQISIGMATGLFLGALAVYPRGKGGQWTKDMKSGLFSF